MRRFLKAVSIGIAIVIAAIVVLAATLTVLYYKRIADFTPTARPKPGTIIDNYEGVWAIDNGCNNNSPTSTRTLIDTTGDYSRFQNFRFQCDMIFFPKEGDRIQEIALGCWKAVGRSLADHGGKSLKTLMILDRDSIMIDRDHFTRCRS